MRIGYGRVSTRDQNPDAQHDALAAAGCDEIFADKASGKLARRPELDKALLVARGGDQFVVTKLDRLGRSLEHLLELSKHLQARVVHLVVLDQGIETSTAAGRMFFSILGAIAEFERALMSERTTDGLAAAPRPGPYGWAEAEAHPAPGEDRPGDVRVRGAHRAADRRRVRRHPANHLPSRYEALQAGRRDLTGAGHPHSRTYPARNLQNNIRNLADGVSYLSTGPAPRPAGG